MYFVLLRSIATHCRLSKVMHGQAWIYIYRATVFIFSSFRLRSQPRFKLYFVERTALFPVRAMLTFVQKRPIGLGIKNNLGSLYWLRALFLLSLCPRDSLCSRAAHSTNSSRSLLDIYSRTSCSWRSLSPNFPENWKNMLLNAFLLTYVWNFVILSSGRSRDPNLSFFLFLSPMCCILSLFLLFWTNRSHPCTSSVVLCIKHLLRDSRYSLLTICDLVLSYVVLMCRSLWPE